MSLVNQVLRDLDARREAPPLDDALEGLRSAPPATRSAHKAGVALGAVALLGLAGSLGWLYLQAPTPAPGAAVSAPKPASAPAQPRPDPEPAPAPPAPVLHPASPDALPALDSGTGFQALATPPGAGRSDTGEDTPATALAEPAPGPSSAAPTNADTAGPAAPTPPATATSMRKTPRPLSPQARAEQAFAAGLEALQQNQWRVAEQRLRKALEADAAHLRARESLAGLLLHQDRRREAEQLLAAGLETQPQAPALARLYARLILDRGRSDTAIRVLETALANAVDDAEYLALLAGIYQRSQRYAEAVSSYRAALSLESGRAAWWLGLGLALEGRGEVKPAAGAYRSALANPGLNEAARRYARQRLQRLDALLGRQ